MKFFLLIVILIILFLIGFYYGFGLIKTGGYYGKKSDHFDGKLFFNSTVSYKKKSTIDLFRWWFSRDRKQWPSHRETQQATITPVTKNKQVRITFVNHASVLIQTKETNILTDPIWSYRASPVSFWGPKRVREPGIAFEKLPPIHIVLISHNHYDHLDIDTLTKLDHQFHPVFIVPLGNKSILNQYNIHNVVELDWWQSYKAGHATITLLPTQHWSARWLNDKFRTLWGSYGINIDNKKIYFSGDSAYSSHFAEIQKRWGTPDIAFLPIGSYQPEWFMKESHMDPEEAVKAHLDLQSHHSIPIHFGTFQLSDEAIDQPVIDLKAALTSHSVPADQFIVLNEGESKEF